jgi:hypothetical protein
MPLTLRAMDRLAGIYFDRARYDDAEALFKQALKGMRAKLGPAHPDSACRPRTSHSLARLFLFAGVADPTADDLAAALDVVRVDPGR